MKYKFLEHTADIKFQAFGKTLGEAFENSARAMFNAMYKGKVKGGVKKKINVKGKDIQELLYNFLEELLFLLDSDGLFLSDVMVVLDEKNKKLSAEVVGDDSDNYEIGLDVKAITYNDMFVKKIKGVWVCQVVVDV